MQFNFAIRTFSKTKYILLPRRFNSKVPIHPVITLEKQAHERTKVDTNTISLLERLSLVKCDTDEGVNVLEDSIAFADKILHIDTTGVEPLYTVLEKENLTLREDIITQGNCQKDILKNAAVTEDDYFVAPPGNIPLHEITTTPSLFSINDMKQGAESADVNIIANFNWGPQTVETISINSNGLNNNNNNKTKTSSLTCDMGLETALLTLLLDGISNATKEEYLRLHNRMAPYKISFALDSEDEKILSTLKQLARLIFHKLSSKEISSWFPTFTLPLQLQIKENLHMGVTYTAILNENTLSNGIFHLLNSNTMLKEQVHVADFDTYAALLCGKY
ncbi:DNA polymerase subunit gamma-2, mitochondrial-like isoform X3 [Maniola jurtina]|uniref:DNA polymerase subunit gamma-2, mitochondrial-like isoform X3 n=1 Tax=Maniola jurtina TaxID=191418 RepID=UPI001E68B45B|nr:DNA polymerase subunit gamma-2, mitochondrial-like isoform X3 [Maniola jurtina]